MTANFARSVADFHAAFAVVADGWLNAMRQAPTGGKAAGDNARRVILPFSAGSPQLLDMGEVIAELRQGLLLSPDERVRKKVDQRLSHLVGELVTVSDRVLEGLCDVVWEVATRRVLVFPGDRLDVSAIGVLVSLGMANLIFAWEEIQRQRQTPLPTRVERAVALPVKLAGELELPVRPGDLWLLDLMARSVRFAPVSRQLDAASAQSPAAQSWDRLLNSLRPRFVAVSSINKLLEADQLGSQLAQKCKYRSWPGLRPLVVDDDTAGLRSLVLGELARNLVVESSVVTRGAAIRLIQALLKLDEPLCQVRARSFIARLLWEMLEQDAEALRPFFSDRRYMESLSAALQAVEETPDDVTDETRREWEVLTEIRECLKTYEQYRALVNILKPSRSLIGRGGSRGGKHTHE